MNLIKALEGLSGKTAAGGTDNSGMADGVQTRPSPPPEKAETPNVMASVIERHERISNRVRSNKR